jgi:hypothetical protein
MHLYSRGLVVAVALLLGTSVPRAADAPATPEATLTRYLQALKDGQAETVYELSSTAMRQGKEKDVWVKEQRAMMTVAEVKILDFKVQPGKVEGDRAQVPNILSAQDKFLNQLGLTEYELYTLVREGGQWRVDAQIIVEPPDMPKWFPNVHMRSETPAPH